METTLLIDEEVVSVAELHKFEGEGDTAADAADCTWTCAWTCAWTGVVEQQ
ncbi:MAG: hypothetical protein LCH85_01085 [Chloroflexi bacterium]|nr:hypothetical protein [Chloroflexota bacterium]